MTEPTMFSLPPHIRADLTIYVTSDETGLESAVRIGGLSTVMAGDFTSSTERICKEVARMIGSDDVRPMTASEVSDYLRREREEGAA